LFWQIPNSGRKIGTILQSDITEQTKSLTDTDRSPNNKQSILLHSTFNMKFFVSLIATAIAAVSASTYNETVSSSCGSNCPGT
jgi:hypothetical protein